MNEAPKAQPGDLVIVVQAAIWGTENKVLEQTKRYTGLVVHRPDRKDYRRIALSVGNSALNLIRTIPL